MKRKIILIDGNNLVYRAFFALPTTLATAYGQVTNAAYGFTSMLLKLLWEEKPDVIAVAFDRGTTFRREKFREYKANRQPAPSELPPQFGMVKDVLKALRIPVFEVEGYEADDVLATLAKQAEAERDEVMVVTGDRDAFQLVDDGVKIMTTRKGISDIVIYDRAKVIERFGIAPEKMADLLALKGDVSDNIPGIPGVGEKTAAKLIQDFGDLEHVLENTDKIANARLRQVVEAHREQAELAKRLALLDTEVPVDVDFDEFPTGRWDLQEVRDVFTALEFQTLLERFLAREAARMLTPLEVDVATLEDPAVLTELESALKGARLTAFAFSLEGANAIGLRIGSIGVAIKPGRAYVGDLADAPKLLQTLRAHVSSEAKKVFFDSKAACIGLRAAGSDLKGEVFDVRLASYLLAPERGEYSIGELAAAHLKKAIGDEAGTTAEAKAEAGVRSAAGAKTGASAGVEVEAGAEPEAPARTRLGREAAALLMLVEPLEGKLAENGLEKLYRDVELPLSIVLAKMELHGVRIDPAVLGDLSKELEVSLAQFEQDIYRLAGEEFNINSSQQLSSVLFEKLKLAPTRKIKAGYSTDSAALSKLAEAHPIIEGILAYRELAKLKGTYVDALPRLINSRTKRLYTSFNQAVTSTGRLSSSNPNLQNIPIRSELGQRIRQAFIPSRPEDEFMAGDYSQIELRLLAHFSRDQALMEAFERDEDIHATTACRLFSVVPQDVTHEMRRVAKAVNFGVLYGMSPYGLSERIGSTIEEAKEYIDRYFAQHPNVEKFVHVSVELARRNGYATTLLGRRRRIPELTSSNPRVRSLGERLAVNTPLQGSAADVVKLAMIRLDRELEERGLLSRLVLQVHDELILEVPPLEMGIAEQVLRQAMEEAYPLDVRVKVEISSGRNWRELK